MENVLHEKLIIKWYSSSITRIYLNIINFERIDNKLGYFNQNRIRMYYMLANVLDIFCKNIKIEINNKFYVKHVKLLSFNKLNEPFLRYNFFTS